MTYEQYTNGNATIAERSSREIQSDLREIRGELRGTLQALSDHFQPGQLLQQGLDFLKGEHGGRRFWRNLSRSVEENPVPLALIGAGCVYLAYSETQRRRPERWGEAEIEETEIDRESPLAELHDRAEERAHALRHGAEHKARRVREGAQHKAWEVREGAQELGQQVREGAQELGQHVREGAQEFREHVREGAQELGEQVRGKMHDVREMTRDELNRTRERARQTAQWGHDLVQKEPLILAGLGVALGAAIATLAPISRREQDLLGKANREIRRVSSPEGQEPSVGDLARKTADTAIDKAESVGRTVVDELKSVKETELPSERGPSDG